MTKPCHRRLGSPLVPTSLLGLAVAALFAAFAPSGLAAQEAAARETMRTVRAAGPGERMVAPDLKSAAELVTLDRRLTPELLALGNEATLRVADWPVAPEARRDVLLTRHEVYAPDARLLRVDGKGATGMSEVPRSRLAFYWGTAEDDDQVRVFLSLDPVTGALASFTQLHDGLYELRPAPGRTAKAGQHLVAAPEAFVAGLGAKGTGGAAPRWSCGEEEALQDPTHTSKILRSILGATTTVAAPFTDLHSATVGVDTDNELMLQKFNDDTTAASNYIASLIAAMNVMYERDLHVRLLQGTTFLRVSTTADPYVQNDPNSADGNELSEFSNYWNANYGSVSRAVAMMLSGKQGSTNVASGIAWISGLCSKSYGYSFTQVFKINYLAGDASVVGHEIGHNFGSPHTHCYSPPADNCYAGESGCYSGPTSCPAPQTINGVTNVVGTVMSYCQFAGCNPQLVFHPRSLTEYINSAMAAANNVCLIPVNTGPVVAAIFPKGGTTAGGTAVAIAGANFQAGASVSIGGVAATGVSVLSPTSLTATTGAHAMGLANVSVTNPDTMSGSLSNGYFYDPPSGALSFYTLTPCRVVDTRNPNGPLGGPALSGGTQRTFTLTGHCGIPSGARSVSANITITGALSGGYLSAYPGNGIPLGTTTLNFSVNQTRTNNAVLELAPDGTGTVGVQNGGVGAVQVIIDVNGYFM
jgi:metallopeptidase family M12-like protein/IPT/TIG domain-containing protein